MDKGEIGFTPPFMPTHHARPKVGEVWMPARKIHVREEMAAAGIFERAGPSGPNEEEGGRGKFFR